MLERFFSGCEPSLDSFVVDTTPPDETLAAIELGMGYELWMKALLVLGYLVVGLVSSQD
jgi:hypothetical protein